MPPQHIPTSIICILSQSYITQTLQSIVYGVVSTSTCYGSLKPLNHVCVRMCTHTVKWLLMAIGIQTSANLNEIVIREVYATHIYTREYY